MKCMRLYIMMCGICLCLGQSLFADEEKGVDAFKKEQEEAEKKSNEQGQKDQKQGEQKSSDQKEEQKSTQPQQVARTNNAQQQNSSGQQKSSDDHSVSVQSASQGDDDSLEVVDQKPISRISLDTLDLDAGGNWLNKRYWYEKAQELFGEIREAVVQVIDSRNDFYKEVSTIGKQLDDFYDTFSFDQGQVEQVLKDALQEIGLFREQRGDLSEKERALKQSILLEQKSIEQFGALLKNIHTIDQTIEDTFGKALAYIDTTRKYEAEAWESFKAIGHELDDKKAEVEFYKMESYLKNVQQAQDYLQHKLLAYLQNDLIAKARTQMDAMKNAFKTLQDKNIDLVKILNGEYAKDIEAEKQRLKDSAQKDAQEKAQKEQEQKKKKPVEPKWYEQYGESMEGFLHWMHNLLCLILDLLHQAWCFVMYYAKEFYCYVQCYMQ
jgi:hypothetical protein